MKKKLLLLAMMCYLAHAQSNRRKRPTCWIRPWIRRRSQLGFSSTLVRELATEDAVEFHQMFRMDIKDYQWLLNNVTSRLTKCDTHMRRPISPAEKLQITLRFLATGNDIYFP